MLERSPAGLRCMRRCYTGRILKLRLRDDRRRRAAEMKANGRCDPTLTGDSGTDGEGPAPEMIAEGLTVPGADRAVPHCVGDELAEGWAGVRRHRRHGEDGKRPRSDGAD